MLEVNNNLINHKKRDNPFLDYLFCIGGSSGIRTHDFYNFRGSFHRPLGHGAINLIY